VIFLSCIFHLYSVTGASRDVVLFAAEKKNRDTSSAITLDRCGSGEDGPVGQALKCLHFLFMNRVDAARAEEHGDLGTFPQETECGHEGVVDLTELVMKTHD